MIMWYFCNDCNELYSVVVRQEYSINCTHCHSANVQRVSLGVEEEVNNG